MRDLALVAAGSLAGLFVGWWCFRVEPDLCGTADWRSAYLALLAAVRRHRDCRGDDRCHADDGELYAALPEGDTRPARETAVTLENCRRYIECRQTGREYVSPQRRIEELEAEVAGLKARPGPLELIPLEDAETDG